MAMSTTSSTVVSDLGKWTSLSCEKMELRIDITLDCGQSFRWHETSPGIWAGVMNGYVWTLSQTEHELLYQVYDSEQRAKNGSEKISQMEPTKSKLVKKNQAKRVCKAKDVSSACSYNLAVGESSSVYTDIISNYFQLDISLDTLCTQFSEKDDHFRLKASQFKGVRLLRQDPVETLFSFICSSNNNITRIRGMIERMCQQFGENIIKFRGVDYYTFPSVERLACDDVEGTLRDLGFGYRAKFIAESARAVLSKGGSQYLYELRLANYESAKASLMELPGVGAKVADCVCLMSLDKLAAIPVDTHVKQIAERDYSLQMTTKSCTEAVYNRIGNYFRNLWGPYAGWAQCVLFASDLKKFREADVHRATDMADIKDNGKRKRKTTDV